MCRWHCNLCLEKGAGGGKPMEQREKKGQLERDRTRKNTGEV